MYYDHKLMIPDSSLARESASQNLVLGSHQNGLCEVIGKRSSKMCVHLITFC